MYNVWDLTSGKLVGAVRAGSDREASRVIAARLASGGFDGRPDSVEVTTDGFDRFVGIQELLAGGLVRVSF